MSSSMIEELQKTNENLQIMIGLQKMIIDHLIPETNPTKAEKEALEAKDEYVNLDEFKETVLRED